MKQLLSITLAFTLVRLISQPGAAQQVQPSPTPGGRGGRGGGTPPPIQAKPEELAKIKEKTEQIDALVKDLKAKRAQPELVGDVEVYAHAGQMLLEYPDMFANQAAIEHAFSTLDQGQIQLDCFGRIHGAGWHWAGEMDVFESIAAVKKRFNIDDKRVMIRGFSQGGEGAWHIALHYPDRFAAAEIGAGTVSRRAQQGGLQPFQLLTLRIWENISEWALNIYNLPLAGHDGEQDPGQLESSLRARAQLEREGFPSEGEPDYLRSKGAPGLFMISKNTGHGTSPLVRQRLDAFLKESGDKGQSSPSHIRFLTYTTRYNRSYWVSLDG